MLPGARNSKADLAWDEHTTSAFDLARQLVITTTMLVHSKEAVLLSVATDTSDNAVGSVLQQEVRGQWQPLSFLFPETESHQAALQQLQPRVTGGVLGLVAFQALRQR